MQKLLKQVIVLAITLVAGMGVMVAIFGSTKVAAADYNFSVTIPEGEILEVKLFNSDGTAMGSSTSMNVAPSSLSSAGFNEKNVVVSVATSNEFGYNLVMNVANTNLTSSENNTIPNLASKAGGYTCSAETAATCDFTVNSWGFKIKNNTATQEATNYIPVPSTINLNKNSSVTNGDPTYLSFGSRVNAAQAPGSYQTTINFTATANPDPTPVMQNMTASTLASLVPNDSDVVTLKDSRDGNKYNILNINNSYWMVENLRITGTVSASESNFTGADFNISAGGDLDLGATYTEPRTHYDNDPKYGAYYNYCAASAGTICNDTTQQNATSDICPAGWRLPTKDEFSNIEGDGSQIKFSTMAGLYNTNALLDMVGKRGFWWSSTYNNVREQYRFTYLGSNGTVVVDYNGNKRVGLSIRCIYGPLPPTMQNVDSTRLAELIPKTGDTITLPDERDNTTYTVGRLADGKVWMLDNLALDLTNSTTLNNTTASNTNASAASITSLKSGNRSAGDNYATAGVSNWTSSYSYSAPLVNATSKDQTQPLAMGQSGTGKIGVYYNYCAASAGSYCYGNGTSSGSPSGNASEDICPKGWRMPTGGSSGEYQALYTAYSGNFVNALKTPLSGNFYDGSAYNQGSYGYFWSSTYRSATTMYSLGVMTPSVSPQNYNDRISGLSVRCVAGS